MHRPRVLVITGYFDWFSGYQETGLVRALKQHAAVHVLASNRVSPIFSDEHLDTLGVDRFYPVGVSVEHGVTVRRLHTREFRSMVWSGDAIAAISSGSFDHIIQVMPGQLLPVSASLARTSARRSVLYGDNSAMYAGLPPTIAKIKFLVFSVTKGMLYRYTNRRANDIFGYTPETVARLRRFSAGKSMQLLPLAFDEQKFSYNPTQRVETRHRLGISSDAIAIIAPGKVNRQKRFDALVDAVAQLRSETHNIHLIFVGLDNGPASEELRARVRERGLSENSTLHDFVDATQLNALFNAADLGVWPSMPAITIQQSMGTGLRVLVPENSLVRHLVPKESVGSLFSIDDDLPQTLARCIATELRSAETLSDRTFRSLRRAHNEWLSTSSLAKTLLSPPPQGGNK